MTVSYQKSASLDPMLIVRAVFILLFVSLVFLTGPVCSTVYYVATDGKDENPGTAAAPLRTLAKAESLVQAGDIVTVRDGTYHVGLNGFVTRKSGTADRPITFQAEHVGHAVLINFEEVKGWQLHHGQVYKAPMIKPPVFLLEDEDALWRIDDKMLSSIRNQKEMAGKWYWQEGFIFAQMWDADDPAGHIIRMSGGNIVNLTGQASYQVWDGFRMEYGLCGWKTHNETNRYNIVRNSTFRYLGFGVLGAPDGTIEHNYFHNIGASGLSHGIYTNHANTIIRYNRFEQISGGSIHLYSKPNNVIAYGNLMKNPKLIRVQNEGAVAIYAWGKGKHRLFRNLILGPHRIGINVNSNNNLIANNIILNTTEAAVYLHEKSVANSLFNNVIGGSKHQAVVNTQPNAFDYNYYIGTSLWFWQGEVIKGLNAWQQASGLDTHAAVGMKTPFINFEQRDYTPTADGPLVDKGMMVEGVTEGFAGGAPDIGAIELGGSAAPEPGPQWLRRPKGL